MCYIEKCVEFAKIDSFTISVLFSFFMFVHVNCIGFMQLFIISEILVPK